MGKTYFIKFLFFLAFLYSIFFNTVKKVKLQRNTSNLHKYEKHNFTVILQFISVAQLDFTGFFFTVYFMMWLICVLLWALIVALPPCEMHSSE